jgi:multidrug efflux system membrane fusion protein
MRRLLPYLIFVLVTGGLVAFVYKDRIFPKQEAAEGAPQGATGAPGGRPQGGGYRRGNQIVPVLAEKARTDNVPVYLSGVGTVQAFNTTTVRTQVSGRLIDVPYTEGQDVKAGDVLAVVDPALYQAAYDQAVAQKAKDEALLANARLDAKRYADLVKTNAATTQQADTAKWTVLQDEAQVKLDQALIDNAKANLEWATIRAPIAGRTGIRLVDKGNLVSATDATGIVVIAQMRPIAIVFTLPESTVAGVLDAQERGPVPLQAVTGAGLLGEGKLLALDNQIDQTTGTVKIKGIFPNDKNRLWPGQFVNVKLKLKTLENAIVVPSVALQQGANGTYVYLVTPENTAKLTYVKVVQEGEKQSVIGEGVAAGDTIITSGFASLQDGSKIRIDTGAANSTPSANAAPGQEGGAKTEDQGQREAKPEHRRHRKEASAEGDIPEGEQVRDWKKAKQSAGQAEAATTEGTRRP